MLIENQMRLRMVQAALKANKVDHVARAVSASYNAGAGVHFVRDWDAKLSMRTYDHLKRTGVMT